MSGFQATTAGFVCPSIRRPDWVFIATGEGVWHGPADDVTVMTDLTGFLLVTSDLAREMFRISASTTDCDDFVVVQLERGR